MKIVKNLLQMRFNVASNYFMPLAQPDQYVDHTSKSDPRNKSLHTLKFIKID